MYINDPIGDFITRIRNAQLRQKSNIVVPASKMIVAISEILKEEGFIENFAVQDTKPRKSVEVELKYVNGAPAIRTMKRVSKPGIRKYVGYKDVQSVMRGLGIAILSTPQGLMTDRKARAAKVGGEYLCQIY